MSARSSTGRRPVPYTSMMNEERANRGGPPGVSGGAEESTQRFPHDLRRGAAVMFGSLIERGAQVWVEAH